LVHRLGNDPSQSQ